MSERPETKNPLRNAKIIGSVDSDAYRRQPGRRGEQDFVMSRGELMEFNRCPHRWIMGYESEETKATDWGSLVDCLALTPDAFPTKYAVTPAEYPGTPKKKGDPIPMKPWNRNATYCQEWEEAAEGQIVKPAELEAAKSAVETLLKDPQIKTLIECSQKQVMGIAEYHDEATGIVVPLKILLDLVPGAPFEKALADLKTCTSASPFHRTKAVFERSYHVQGALYSDVYVAATGEYRCEFLHIWQESYPPWEVGKSILSSEFIDLGRAVYLGTLARYCKCLSENNWPGYDEGKNNLNGWTLTEPLPYMVTA